MVNFHGDYIFVSGGMELDKKLSTAVDAYDIKKDEWFNAPDLNNARHCHSSCVQLEWIYVFCGTCENNSGLIERLNASRFLQKRQSKYGWESIEISPP